MQIDGPESEAGHEQQADQDTATRWWRRRAVLVAGGVLGVVGLLYGVDLALSAGDVPRGVVMVGVQVGGLSRADAEQALRAAIEPRLGRPASVRAADTEATVDPAAAAITVDWRATLDRAGSQPVNPVTRLVSLFTERQVEAIVRGDEPAIRAQLEAMRERVDRPPVEGTIRFEGTTPVAVEPAAGRRTRQAPDHAHSSGSAR